MTMGDATASRSAFMANVQRKFEQKERGSGKRRIPRTSDHDFDRAVDEAVEAMSLEDFSLFLPRHWVAMYVVLHERVYGVRPAELTPATRTMAAAAAKRLLEREFEGDRARMAAYMRWAWTRELGRVEWRRANDREQTRIGWGLCFGGALVTDWRMNKGR